MVSHRGDRFSSSSSADSDGEASPDPSGLTPVRCLGTEDVLTCHVIVLRHPLTATVALAHFDEFIREKGLNRFIIANPFFFLKK